MNRVDNIINSASHKLEKFFPKLERELKTAKIDKTPSTLVKESLKRAGKISLATGTSLTAVGIIFEAPLTIAIGLICYVLLFGMGFFTFIKIPKIKTQRRTRELEKDLPYALRDILIEVQSGIPLFEAMQTVTEGYGEASNEFQIIIKDIQGGMTTREAIEASLVRHPSEKHRRAMWPLSNSIKSGTDIAKTLETVVDSIIEDQKLMIKSYGKELNPYILVYLLIAVVGPSLGITGLIIISSFTGIQIDITFYLGTLGALIVMQIFFLYLIKSRRPELRI
jgi:flagellar protein FlaJ